MLGWAIGGKWRGRKREIGDETCPAEPLFIGSGNLQITSCHHSLALLRLYGKNLFIVGYVKLHVLILITIALNDHPQLHGPFVSATRVLQHFPVQSQGPDNRPRLDSSEASCSWSRVPLF